MDSSDVPARDAAAAGSMSPTIGQKVFYSLGQAAQSGGFDTAVGFVFFYYSVVLGLSGALVGAEEGFEPARPPQPNAHARLSSIFSP